MRCSWSPTTGRASRTSCARRSSTASCEAPATAAARSGSGCRSCARWPGSTAAASPSRTRSRARGSWYGCRRWSRPRLHLYHDRQHHRPPFEPVVDEAREVVVQGLLQEVDLADLLARGALERLLDRDAQLVEQLGRLLLEGHPAEDDLGVGDARAVLLGDRRHHDEDAVGAQVPAVSEGHVGDVADVHAVDEQPAGLDLVAEARARLVDLDRAAVDALEDVGGLDADGLGEPAVQLDALVVAVEGE